MKRPGQGRRFETPGKKYGLGQAPKRSADRLSAGTLAIISMDALPIAEATGLPYASKVKAKDRDGNTVLVGHMCGHDMNAGN